MSAAPQVVRLASATDLASAAADRAAEVLGAAVRDRGVAHLVITGGGILEAVLAALAQTTQPLDWSGVHIWWGDERFVPADSDDRNDKPADEKLLDRVPLDPAKVHRMPAADAEFGADAEAAATSYETELAAFAGGDGTGVPRFDLVLLGVGPDGHCCSLFPHQPGTQVLDRPVIAVHDSPKPPPVRLSLTFPALDAAAEVWFIAAGSAKADAVRQALGGADRTDVPSAGPRGLDHTLWLVDEDAAAQLGAP